jgi:quercetin dioxygenase-like cupin family protein
MNDDAPYFDLPSVAPAAPGRFVTIDTDLPTLGLLEGLVVRPLVGRDVLVSFARYEPRCEVPMHAHEEEQVLIVVDGELELEMEGEKRLLRPGDAAHMPAYVPHATRTLDAPAYQIDVFTPPRKPMVELLASRD